MREIEIMNIVKERAARFLRIIESLNDYDRKIFQTMWEDVSLRGLDFEIAVTAMSFFEDNEHPILDCVCFAMQEWDI